MCPDCREITDEYEELLSNWKRANFALEQRIEEMEYELAGAKVRAGRRLSRSDSTEDA